MDTVLNEQNLGLQKMPGQKGLEIFCTKLRSEADGISILNFSDFAGNLDNILTRAETSEEMIIVDDWCESWKSREDMPLRSCRRLPILLIITSSSYEDASDFSVV